LIVLSHIPIVLFYSQFIELIVTLQSIYGISTVLLYNGNTFSLNNDLMDIDFPILFLDYWELMMEGFQIK